MKIFRIYTCIINGCRANSLLLQWKIDNKLFPIQFLDFSNIPLIVQQLVRLFVNEIVTYEEPVLKLCKILNYYKQNRTAIGVSIEPS